VADDFIGRARLRSQPEVPGPGNSEAAAAAEAGTFAAEAGSSAAEVGSQIERPGRSASGAAAKGWPAGAGGRQWAAAWAGWPAWRGRRKRRARSCWRTRTGRLERCSLRTARRAPTGSGPGTTWSWGRFYESVSGRNLWAKIVSLALFKGYLELVNPRM
jgi:hypothetical protein